MKCLVLLSLLAPALAGCQNEQRPPAAGATPSFYASMAQAGAAVDGAMARDLVGAYRRNNGLGPLVLDPDLQAAAQREAAAMAAASRCAASGFKAPAANLSAGYHTLAEAFSGWRESAQHNRVMLDPRATRIGIATAYAPGSKYKVYWALAVAADRR